MPGSYYAAHGSATRKDVYIDFSERSVEISACLSRRSGDSYENAICNQAFLFPELQYESKRILDDYMSRVT